MVTCSPIIDITQLLGPVMLSKTLKGEEFDISPLIDVIVGQKITESLLASVSLPSEFADLGDIFCLQIQLEQVKAVTSMLKGETYEFDISKVIDTLVSLNMISAITSSLGSV